MVNPKKNSTLRQVSKVLSFEITKKNPFLFGYLLTYSYLCTRFETRCLDLRSKHLTFES